MTLLAFALSFAHRREPGAERRPFPWLLACVLSVALLAFIAEVLGG